MLTIRRATPSDAIAIAALVRESFRPADLDLTIYGCAGIAAYLAMQFALPPTFSPSAYLVAETANRIAGFVEMRARENGLCLNYIATSPACRGAGVARELLAVALRALQPPADAAFTLDVFEHNQIALDWYRRMGFRPIEHLAFWQFSPPSATNTAEQVRILDLPQADVTHGAFGFSSFHLVHDGRTFPIGRLGDRWFRITESELLRRTAALRALHSLDPHREFLFFGAGQETAGLSPLLRSIRMKRQL